MFFLCCCGLAVSQQRSLSSQPWTSSAWEGGGEAFFTCVKDMFPEMKSQKHRGVWGEAPEHLQWDLPVQGLRS